MLQLLKDAIQILNQIPRKKISHSKYKDTYEFLSAADKLIAANKDKYVVVYSEDQLRIVRDATEWYCRFLAGQLDMIPPIIETSKRVEDKWAFKNLFKPIKEYLFPELSWGASYGVGWNNDQFQQESQKAYEIYRPVYEQFTKEQRDTGKDVSWSVYNHEGLHYSDQPKVVIEKI